MAVVTIARQYGAGARVVGRMVAERLGYEYYDKEVLDHVARKADVAVETVKSLDDSAGDPLIKLIDELVSSKPYIRGAPGIATDFDEGKLRTFLIRIIRGIAARDRAVIIGRGGQLILKDHPNAIRIYLVAEVRDRVENLIKDYGVSRKKAETLAVKAEKRRQAFLQSFELGKPEDHALYHLIVNTSRATYQEAVEAICRLAEEMERSAVN